MAFERFDLRSPHHAFPSQVLRSRDEAIAELLQPCGKFKSPVSSEEKLRSFIASYLEKMDVVPGPALSIHSGMPLNWESLLIYLYEQGVITAPRFAPRSRANDRPKVFNFELEFDRARRPTDGSIRTKSGFGGAFSREVAIAKTIGETLERSFLSTYSRKGMLYRSADQLRKRGKRVLDIGQLNGFLPSQKETSPQFACDKDTPLFWIQGEEFQSGKKTLLPSQLVFWNYAHKGGGVEEKVLAHTTTSGCAGYFSRQEAVLGGVLESIQRDGFLIYWLNKISPNVLDVGESSDPEVIALLSYLERYSLKPTFLNTTTDIGVPSIICVIQDLTTDEPVISIGGSSGFDLTNMVVQSAIEALIINNFIAENEAFKLPDDYVPFSDAGIGRNERLGMWKGKRMADRFSFFLSGKKQGLEDFMGEAGAVTGAPERLAFVMGKLAALGKGYETYVYEAKDPVLTALGYHVVRTIVPQLFPLYLVERSATLDSKRLREVPQKLGFAAAPQLNPWPHPFP